MDSPGMSSLVILPRTISIEVMVATAAGKPLVYFSHRPGENNDETNIRSHQDIVSLSAAFVAFRHAMGSQVRTITTTNGVILSGSFGSLYVVATSSDRFIPFRILLSIATVAVTSIYFLLSSAFEDAVMKRPNLDLGSRAGEVQMRIVQFLKRAVSFPLPAALPATVSHPCPSAPYARRRLGKILISALQAYPSITHLIIFSATPPFPHQVISSVGPVHRKLSPTDFFLLSSMLPLSTKGEVKLPERVFLQTHSFNKASILFAKLVELRLGSRDFENFKACVGGEHWRPEWSIAGAGSVWIVAIGDVSVQPEPVLRVNGELVLKFVESKLDRTKIARDMMVWMERPWRVEDMLKQPVASAARVRGVIVVCSNRIVGTVGAFHYYYGAEILRLEKDRELFSESIRLSSLKSEASSSVCRRCNDLDLWLVAVNNKFMFLSGAVTEERAFEIAEKNILPWLQSNASSLLSTHTFVSLPPKTPLSFLLSPFES